MPKAKVLKKQRHDPLHVDIEEGSGHLRKTARNKRDNRAVDVDGEENEEAYINSKATRKILDLAREQQNEIEEEENESTKLARSVFASDYREPEGDENNWEEESDEDEEADYEEYEEFEEFEVDPEEENIFQRYVDEQNGGEPINLADKILAKVHEFEMKQQGLQPEPQAGVMLPPKVIQVYTQVGELLSRFRSGRLPRAFKIIPSLKNWRDILYVTQPDAWSNQAVYEGTKLFVSNLQSNQAQAYVNEILLERFRDQVASDKTVNYHVYRSLKKSLYKPAAFFKGFLFPLVESGTCTLREAIIASSVVARVSVPALHSAAALLHLAEMDYSGPNSLFIKVLLDKKYALPYKVVDAMVFHFVRFRDNEYALPVIWHQSLLTFAQRYKNDITDDQRDALIAVVRLQSHPSISPEIRRELLAGHPRESEMKE